MNQKLAIRLLEKAGHRVTLASTGREALAAWENAGIPGFDVVLMDIQMPEMDGMEATAAIREREKSSGKHIPILAMTAHAMRGDKERYLASGMDGYVSKPIHPAGLFAEIERCLAAPGRSNTMTEITQGTGELIDRVSLLERVEGDQELLTEMIHLFQEDAPVCSPPCVTPCNAATWPCWSGPRTPSRERQAIFRRRPQPPPPCSSKRTQKTRTRNPRRKVLRRSNEP